MNFINEWLHDYYTVIYMHEMELTSICLTWAPLLNFWEMPYRIFRLDMCVSTCKTKESFPEDGVVGLISDIVV